MSNDGLGTDPLSGGFSLRVNDKNEAIIQWH